MTDDKVITIEDDDSVLVTESSVAVIAPDASASVAVIDAPSGAVVVPDVDQSITAIDDDSTTVSVGEQGPEGARGPKGATGAPGAGASAPVRISCPIGATATVEAVELEVIRSTKWVVTVSAPGRSEWRMGEILAFHDDLEAHYTHYAIFGAQVLYTVQVIVSGLDMVLQVTNADTEALVVDAVRVGNIPV